MIEDSGTGFLPEYPDGVAFTPPDWTNAQPGMREFRGSQCGMVGVIKQLIDHLMQELSIGAPFYLAIERLIVETNIALVRKSTRPGGAWPGYISDAPMPWPIPPHALGWCGRPSGSRRRGRRLLARTRYTRSLLTTPLG
ncbi:hypothetical protein [Rhodopila sp.]|uniref:hypothetical protein n=1 Tax=Rhodopila sp. TaxID=2480087 RepID=UPI002D00F491|nr:hypothetical protein [Rhodopila sp.]HVZ07111.1 hypothetical protein [Rhodopila sp.]